MLQMIFNGHINEAILLMIIFIISLSFHEFGHAWTAKKFGDDTAEQMGRLTLNPIVHIDPMGLLLLAVVGFGYARPVQTNPRKFTSPTASLWISAAGPGMNLLLAFVAINLLSFGFEYNIDILVMKGVVFFLQYMTYINLMLMLFNLLPIGPLDGHYILPYFLSRDNAYRYLRWNDQYGAMLLMSLVMLSFAGIHVFSFLMRTASHIADWLIIF